MVAKNLKKKYKKRFNQLKKLLTFVQAISLTCDLWQKRNATHFLTLTAHFFDPNHEYVSLIVSFRRFKGQKLSERLKEYIKLELIRLEIEGKVVSITTDSGADIKKATSGDDFGIRIPCLAHKLNLTIKNSLKLWSKQRYYFKISIKSIRFYLKIYKI